SARAGQSAQVLLSYGETLAAIGGILEGEGGQRARAVEKTRQGSSILRKLAPVQPGSAALLRIAEAHLTARPAELQDARFARACVEHLPDASAALLKARALRRMGREADAVRIARS